MTNQEHVEKGFAFHISRHLGDSLYNSIYGSFSSLYEAATFFTPKLADSLGGATRREKVTFLFYLFSFLHTFALSGLFPVSL
jgi:hypothetical protein